MDCNSSGFSVHGISQARILEWVAIFFSRRSSQSRDRIRLSCVASRLFNAELSGKPKYSLGKAFVGVGVGGPPGSQALIITGWSGSVNCFYSNLATWDSVPGCSERPQPPRGPSLPALSLTALCFFPSTSLRGNTDVRLLKYFLRTYDRVTCGFSQKHMKYLDLVADLIISYFWGSDRYKQYFNILQ